MTSSSCRFLPELYLSLNVGAAAGNSSRCLVVSCRREPRTNLCLRAESSDTCGDRIAFTGVDLASCRNGSYLPRAPSSSFHIPEIAAYCVSKLSDGTGATEAGSDSDSDSDSDKEAHAEQAKESRPGSTPQTKDSKEEGSFPNLPRSSESLDPESWLLIEGDEVPIVVSSLPLRERYAPRRLLEFLSKKLDSSSISTEQLKSTLMFWKKKKKDLDEHSSFAASAFGEEGVSSVHQWAATELTLQHTRLVRIARDILYLVLACSLLGVVRILEAISVTFSTRPPHFSKLLDAANCLDFFTMAFLAYSVRKPVIGILRVDPVNLDEVVKLKSKIWDEMHKFYERQWKLVATLAVTRLLALIAQRLPSTNALTKNIKMCWDFLLALPIF